MYRGGRTHILQSNLHAPALQRVPVHRVATTQDKQHYYYLESAPRTSRISAGYCRRSRIRECFRDVYCVQQCIRTCVNVGPVSAYFCGMRILPYTCIRDTAYSLTAVSGIRLRIQAVSMRLSDGSEADGIAAANTARGRANLVRSFDDKPSVPSKLCKTRGMHCSTASVEAAAKQSGTLVRTLALGEIGCGFVAASPSLPMTSRKTPAQRPRNEVRHRSACVDSAKIQGEWFVNEKAHLEKSREERRRRHQLGCFCLAKEGFD